MNAILNSLLALAVVGCLVAAPVIHYGTMENVQVVVTDKDRITTKDDSKYLIFTDGEVFENTDSWLSLKFGSSDVYGKIAVGQTCNFQVAGIRVPFLSMYRNIITSDCKA